MSRIEPLDAMALAIEPYCRDPAEAKLAAKDACDILVAFGYFLQDMREELKAVGIEVPDGP